MQLIFTIIVGLVLCLLIADAVAIYSLQTTEIRLVLGFVGIILLIMTQISAIVERRRTKAEICCLIAEQAQKTGEKLFKERQFLQILIDNLPVAVFAKNAHSGRFEFILCNKTTEHFLGFDAKHILGKTVYDVFSKTQADEFTVQDHEVFKMGKIIEISEEVVESPTLGKIILHTAKVPIFDENHEPLYLLGISENITKRKQAEDNLLQKTAILQATLENMLQGIMMVDKELRLVAYNERLRELFNLPEDFSNNHLYLNDVLQELVKRFGYTIDTLQPLIPDTQLAKTFTFEIPTPDNRVIEATHSPVDGGGFVRTFIDITTRKQAEERLQLQNVELRIQNEQLDAFAHTLEELQQEQLFQLNKAYERFVPSEFLKLLGKASVIDVHLGDQIEKEMTVMFCDIRNFTARAEKMTPQAIFDFINAYLEIMAPIISQHHGFIDKYIGDAIMALFPQGADTAVCAALSMLKTLENYNKRLQESGFEPIEVGIGLNTGRLILGTVGGHYRMDGTVIADAVNIAARVEDLTKEYGTSLLITTDTYLHLTNPLHYHIRVVDVVKVKGKSEVITVYEVFDTDSNTAIALKQQTLLNFEQGFVLYHQELEGDAVPFFEKVLHLDAEDKVAQIYLKRCLYYAAVSF